MPLNRFVSVFIEAVSSSSNLFFFLGGFCLDETFIEIPLRRPVDFLEMEAVDDIILSGSKGFQCKCSLLLLLLVETDRASIPTELLAPPYGFAK